MSNLFAGVSFRHEFDEARTRALILSRRISGYPGDELLHGLAALRGW